MSRRAVSRTLLSLVFALVMASGTDAQTPCSFTTLGTTMSLAGDCSTSTTIIVPDGFTLDGNGFTITAIDPPGGHFLGAVVMNGGATAHVTRLTVTASTLRNACDAGVARLRGILFDRAGGSITHNDVIGINQGPSGCQEGNAIEVRNFESAPGYVASVEIGHNVVADWQKTGVVINGAVDALVHHNRVTASATQANLAANSIQVGFGARATVVHNYVEGNQWCGASDYVATAVLLYDAAAGTEVSRNDIRGNADVGIYIFANGVVVDGNHLNDEGRDCSRFEYDFGIGNWGDGNTVTGNKARGYDVPFDGVSTTGRHRNKSNPHANE